ncbi:hypothetical protein OAO87_03335 [bacterium]|nr:hypothetical protein [bacterium]
MAVTSPASSMRTIVQQMASASDGVQHVSNAGRAQRHCIASTFVHAPNPVPRAVSALQLGSMGHHPNAPLCAHSSSSERTSDGLIGDGLGARRRSGSTTDAAEVAQRRGAPHGEVGGGDAPPLGWAASVTVWGSLTDLNLAMNFLKDQAIVAICEAVQSNKQTKLASLNISSNGAAHQEPSRSRPCCLLAVTDSLTKV